MIKKGREKERFIILVIAVYAGLGGVQLCDRLYFRPVRVVALELAVGYVRGRVRICRLLGETV